MSQKVKQKHVYQICEGELVSAEILWPDREETKGKFVATGIMVFPNGDLGGEVRTSLIVSGSKEEGQVETLNSIYKFVDRPADKEQTDNGLWGAVRPMMSQEEKGEQHA
jgi:hypothetical protein